MSRHNDRVKQLANSYRRRGYRVEADVPGFDTPDGIGRENFVPDLLVSKGGRHKIIEVETEASLQTDKDQLASFRRSAAHSKRTSFDLDVI